MARRRKGRGKRSKTIPVLPLLAGLMPAYDAYMGAGGLNKDTPKWLMYCYTGYSTDQNRVVTERLTKTAVPIVVAFIGHKVANRVGINRHIKKATMGFLSL